jgi:hypothetical protein
VPEREGSKALRRVSPACKLGAAGVSEAAIVDALYVCFLFNVVNRMADARAYDYSTKADALEVASILNRIEYRLPGFLLR